MAAVVSVVDALEDGPFAAVEGAEEEVVVRQLGVRLIRNLVHERYQLIMRTDHRGCGVGERVVRPAGDAILFLRVFLLALAAEATRLLAAG